MTVEEAIKIWQKTKSPYLKRDMEKFICLQACARGAKKTAYGYLWEYAEVNENA